LVVCAGTPLETDLRLRQWPKTAAARLGQSLIFSLCPAVFDGHILALDVARFVQAFLERGHEMGPFSRGPAVEEADHRHRLLLRAGPEWPRRRAAEQRDELASSEAPPKKRSGCGFWRGQISEAAPLTR
jgi:hypothetical protein